MFSLFKKKHKEVEADPETLYLCLDIGTEFLKSAIYRVVDNKAEVIGYSRVPQHSNAMKGAMIINIENVVNTCDIGIGRALEVADKTLGRKCEIPDKVIIGISGELVKGVSIIAHYERDNPEETITNEELEDVIENVKQQAFPDSVEEISEEIGTTADKIKEISSHINSIYIDGNKVENPIGFTGQEVTYRVFSTFAPSLHLNSLYEIAKRLEIEVLGIEVQPYAISQAFKNSSAVDFSSIFIDIGGGTTDLAVIQNGGIMGTKMIGFGGRVFSKRLASKMNIELHDAEKMKLDYSDHKLQETTVKKVADIFETDAKSWVESVEIALGEFSDIESFPTEILISGGGANLPEIKDALLAHPWLTVLPFERFPKIKYIYPNQLDGVEDKTGLMVTSTDVAAAGLINSSLRIISRKAG